MKQKLFAGIDVGGTKIAAGLVLGSGRIIARDKVPTPRPASSRSCAVLIEKMLDGLLAQAGILAKRLDGIGIGIPGIVDAGGKIVTTPNMCLKGNSLKRRLEEHFHATTLLGNDVNLGVLGEKWVGAARGRKNVVGIFVGTGIGGGIISDGRLLLGTHGAAGEIGHMILQSQGPKCSCGNRGCLEALCGRWAIERDIRQAVADGRKTSLRKFARSTKPIKSGMIGKALRKKDRVAVSVMTKASRALGTACISLRHAFDPEILVLGGGVIEACGSFMIPVIKESVRHDPLFCGLGPCKISASQLGDDAVILGGVALVSGLFRSIPSA